MAPRSARKPSRTSRRKPGPSPKPGPAPAPKPSSGSIQHVVIIVKENHAFDNYFGRFPRADGDATLALAPDPPSSDHPHDHASWLKRATGATREQYAEANIPHYWAYARQYTLCDKYFTEVAGPSTPNHLMLIGGLADHQQPALPRPHQCATSIRSAVSPGQPRRRRPYVAQLRRLRVRNDHGLEK